MNLRRTLFSILICCVCCCVSAAEPTDTATVKNPWYKELASRIQLNGYAQAGYEWNDKNGVNKNTFNLKRTLLWAKARITDRWSFLFMMDFSSVVQEFYTDFRITKNNAINVRLGQYKNCLTIENPLSPTVLELVDVCSQGVTYLTGCGSDPKNGVNYGRDLGLRVYGDLFSNQFHYEAAIMSGQGINKLDGNREKDYQLRLEYRPIEGLRIVGTGQLGTGNAINTAAWNPDIAKGDNYTRNRYSIGAEYKFGSFGAAKYKEARPVSIRAEWLGGRDGKVDSQGGYITAAVPLVQGIDLVASADYFDLNTSVKGWQQTNTTIGLQYWFYKKCRLQLQYTHAFCGEQRGPDYNCLQFQTQVAF